MVLYLHEESALTAGLTHEQGGFNMHNRAAILATIFYTSMVTIPGGVALAKATVATISTSLPALVTYFDEDTGKRLFPRDLRGQMWEVTEYQISEGDIPSYKLTITPIGEITDSATGWIDWPDLDGEITGPLMPEGLEELAAEGELIQLP